MKHGHKTLLKGLGVATLTGAAGLAALVGFGDKIFPPVELRKQDVAYKLRAHDWKFGGLNMLYDHDGDGKPDEQLFVWNPSRSLHADVMGFGSSYRTEPSVGDLKELDEEAKKNHSKGWAHYVGSHVKPEQQRWITPRTNKHRTQDYLERK